MTVREQASWWGVGLAVFIGLLWLFADVLFPFVLAAAIAYFTDPLADRLERRGLSRVAATVVITLVVILVALIALTILIPLIVNQIRLAVEAAPDLIGGLKDFLQAKVLPRVDPDGAVGRVVGEALADAQGKLQEVGLAALQGVLSAGAAGLGFLATAVVTPVVAFYLLMDWDHMVARVDELLPRQHAETIRELARRSDRVLAGFVRGQVTVCMILGAFYAASLIAIQLPFGLLIGLFAGLISFIPFVGSILGGALSIGVAIFYFWNDPAWIVATAAVFAVGQAIEGNYLTPKLVGGSVGLHPVWLMFALSAFGALFGFTGLLIAVPTAAVIAVFVRFSVEQYKSGRLYLGADETRDEGRP